ncbi:MAG: hypothetical protein JXA93_14055 [Anaerolineae bacterium]|nr:hypothetical protein [Anaerolineae bacterium]
MKCDQVRDMLLDRLDSDGTIQSMPDLDLHLKECPACQAWYRQQQLAAAAVEKLAPIRVSADFTAQVMAHVPDGKQGYRRARPGLDSSAPTWLHQAWRNLVGGLSSPVGRRRLAPMFVTAGALFVIAVCLLAVAQGTGIPVTPGAATGSSAGPILVGSIVVIVLAALGFLFLRRK